MQGADSIIVAIIGVSVIMGTVRGFIREIVALATWLVAIWVAWRFSGFLHPYLGGVLASSPEEKAWVARGIVLLLVLMAGAFVGHVLSWITRTAAGLSLVDRALGFLFGLARGAVVVGFAVMLGQSLRLEHEHWWEHARLMPYAEYVATWLRGFSGESREIARRALAAANATGTSGGD